MAQVHNSQYRFDCLPLYHSVSQSLCTGSSVALIWDTPVSDGKRLRFILGVSAYGVLCVMSHTGQVRVETGRSWDSGAQSPHHLL